MHGKYPYLLSPMKVGNNILKNRMICPPSAPHLIQGPENFPSEALIAHYAQRAQNGAAIVTCDGGYDTQHEPENHMWSWNAHLGTTQNYMNQLADAIHFYNSKANGVLMLMGPQGYDVSADAPHYYPMPGDIGAGVNPKEMPTDMVYEFIESSAQLAKCHYECGFDGMYIHMSYRAVFPGRFLSPLTNFRTDEFGGSFENRTRFPLLLCKRIKELCGRDFIIEASVSGHDHIPGKGWTIQDSINLAKTADGLIDIMTIRSPSIDPQHPTSFNPVHMPWLYMTEEIKKSNPKVAIAVSGGCFFPGECEEAVASGKADLVSMARSFISNPDYGKLLYEGRDEDIVPCLRCNKCHQSVCAVNPVWPQEIRTGRMIVPPGEPKKIAVIGGGPAGMKAALVAADRGHNVTLYEKTARLGGLINIAENVSFKWTMWDFRNFMDRKVREHTNINLRMNEAPALAKIIAENYDIVLSAVGSSPIIPPIPGINCRNVIPAVNVYGIEDTLDENIAVIGGGEIGVETGLHLAQKGHKVTVVEMQGKLAPEAFRVHYYTMFMEAVEKEPNLNCIVNATCTGISSKGITYTDADGISHEIKAGTVVVAAGMRANLDDGLFYAPAGKLFYSIGDCNKIGNMQKALRNAFSIASTF